MRPRSERGVVLVIALMLAGLLAVLATGAMQSASFELASSAQEQARERALQAAGTADAQLTALLIANPAALSLTLSPAACGPLAAGTCDGTVRYIAADPIVAAASGGLKVGALYTLIAHGRSARGAQVNVEAGWTLVTSIAGATPVITRTYWKRSDVD